MKKMDFSVFFFFNDTATTEIYTLSLHDALPIYFFAVLFGYAISGERTLEEFYESLERSEEHTSELQSQFHLVCRLLLEKKQFGWLRASAPIHLFARTLRATKDSIFIVLVPRSPVALVFFFKKSAAHRDLPPSPTRRPSI